jgi:uncharacterized BrkB/YihY/UPF0761 family membrane protein
METFKKFASIILAAGLLGLLLVTFVAPSIGRLLISAPVSFGTNCEPAADWAVSMLIRSQIIGFFGGVILGCSVYFYLRLRHTRANAILAND